MDKILFKTWGAMSLEEQNEYKEATKEYYEENYGKIETDEDENRFEEYCAEENDNQFLDDFGTEYSNLTCSKSKLNDNDFEVQGTIGKWNGRFEISPRPRFHTLTETISKCLNDDILDFIIAEDRYGNLKITAYHHDNHNLFTIKKVTDKGLRCVNFSREIFGA